MATNIDFYILSTPSMEAWELYICRLTEKAYKKNHRIYIYTVSKHEAQKLNDRLWTFRDINFVPHNVYEENLASSAPIQIGHIQPPTEYDDILINLTPNVPAFYANFKRVLEIIPNDSTLKAAGRSKYKYYQTQGCKLKTHNINF